MCSRGVLSCSAQPGDSRGISPAWRTRRAWSLRRSSIQSGSEMGGLGSRTTPRSASRSAKPPDPPPTSAPRQPSPRTARRRHGQRSRGLRPYRRTSTCVPGPHQTSPHPSSSCCHRRVDPSISVKRNVTVPEGPLMGQSVPCRRWTRPRTSPDGGAGGRLNVPGGGAPQHRPRTPSSGSVWRARSARPRRHAPVWVPDGHGSSS